MRNAPLALKLLAPLLLVALIALAFVASSLFAPVVPVAIEPTAVPASISEVKATVSNASNILVTAQTTLPDGAEVLAQLTQNGEPFDWNEPDRVRAQVFDGKIRIDLRKRDGAPTPDRDALMVMLSGTAADGTSIGSEQSPVGVPNIYADAFYTPSTATAPTAAA
ncbi:MAG: hypothetical protein H7Z42_19230, partial [Roseiflexaceae bacterium]|nr:hypothetical protein [Roseiflexaceae bacterium]